MFLLLSAAAAFSSFTPAEPGKPVTIYIDAAHGGQDPGSVAADGTRESDLCLQFADAIRKKAVDKNVQVVLIRENDEFISLTDRAARTETAGADAYFVSIHMSESENEQDHGFSITTDRLNTKESTSQLAGLIGAEMKDIERSVSINQRGIMVLRKSRVPAVMVSPGYISNPADLERLKSQHYQETVAEKIIAAVTAMTAE